MQKVDFTTNYIANDVFKFSHQAGISKIKTWLDTDIIEKIGEIQVKAGSRPSNHYGLTTIIVAKYIFSDLSVSEFMKQKIKYCSACGTVLLREWTFSKEYRCHKCQEIIESTIS